MKMKLIKTGLSLLALTLASSFVYAEHTAPVYDVDSMSSDSPPVSAVQQDNASKSMAAPPIAFSSAPPATVDQRVARLEQQLENTQQNELANRLNSMQGEVQALRGQVEELTHQLQELHSQQRDLHAEADKAPVRDLSEQSMSAVPRESDDEAMNSNKALRSKEILKASAVAENKLETQASLVGSEHRGAASKLSNTKKAVLPEKRVVEASTASADAQPNLAEEQAVYQTAYNLIKVKKYNEAVASLQKMLVKYPSGQFAANAHYWLGELYSLTGESEQAASEFSVVVKHYPANPRVADAELKLGLINATLLKWPAAKVSFKKVITKYPGTTSARLAMEQLKLLKQAGH